MKISHLRTEENPAQDSQLEIEQLKKILKRHPANDKAYNRLMILYRRQSNYRAELKIIIKAIQTFEGLFKKRQPAYSKTIQSLSRALSRATGLADKKGNSTFLQGDLSKWKKRKELVSKKISAI